MILPIPRSQSSSAPATPELMARAWAHFLGHSAANQAATYSRTGTTVTVTLAAHGYLAGHVIAADFTSGGATDGNYFVTSATLNTFTVEDVVSGTIAPGNTLNLLRRAINLSEGVHDVALMATGKYAINFSASMGTTNYGAWINAEMTSGFVYVNAWVIQRTALYVMCETRNAEANGNMQAEEVNALILTTP